MKKNKRERKHTNPRETVGTVIGHPKGFGFLVQEEQGEDVYLPVYEMNHVLHGDRVKVEINKKSRENKLSGRVINIIARAHKQISGVIKQYEENLVVEPLDKRISHELMIDEPYITNLKEGDVVEADISQYPSDRKKFRGVVTQVFGAASDADMPVKLSLYKYSIPHVWSDAAIKSADKCPKFITEEEVKTRIDLRELNFVTIDGATAKDFDDAICVERTSSGFILRVAIADVSYYIKPNSVLDKIAYERGTSVYFPNRVVPMLPEAYSNGICSLKPNVDRLVLVCEIVLDDKGQKQEVRFYDAVIQSKARLTYSAAWQYFSNSQQSEISPALHSSLDQACELFNCLLDIRKSRGALELDIPEAIVMFDDEGNIAGIEPVSRNMAHRLIEEFMLIANVCAAECLQENLGVGMFRIHERPDEQRVTDLRYFLSEFGIDMIGTDKPNSEDFVAILENPAVLDQWRYIISMMILRTQKQARYSDQPDIHFALNYESYTHFTSPIRRYPDLIVHRLLKAITNKQKPPASVIEKLPDMAEHCSTTERKAEEASREVVTYYKLKYLQKHTGDSLKGVITGVSNFGFFVELDKIFTSGLVHVTSMQDDYYSYDPIKQKLIGDRTANVIRTGDKVTVQIVRVDLEDKKLDLMLVQDDHSGNNQKQVKKNLIKEKSKGDSKNQRSDKRKPKSKSKSKNKFKKSS